MTRLKLLKAKYSGLNLTGIESKLFSEGYKPELVIEPANTSEEPHKHNESYLVVHVDGDMTVSASGEDFVMESGDAVIIPAGLEHTADFGEKGAKYFWAIE